MKRVAVLLVAMLSVYSVMSQGSSDLVGAFSESYVKEKAGNYAEAAAVLKAHYSEKSYEVNLRLGWLTYMQGQFTQSLGYYNRAIGLMPYAVEPRMGAVLPASAMGNWDFVVEQYHKVLSIDPNNTQAHYRLGLIYYERKDYRKAYTHFEKVVNLYPFDLSANLMLGWTNYRLGKGREAKVLFRKALFYDPKNASAKEGLGLIK